MSYYKQFFLWLHVAFFLHCVNECLVGGSLLLLLVYCVSELAVWLKCGHCVHIWACTNQTTALVVGVEDQVAVGCCWLLVVDASQNESDHLFWDKRGSRIWECGFFFFFFNLDYFLKNFKSRCPKKKKHVYTFC